MTHLFQIRYDSLLNSKEWSNDTSKGLGTPTFWPSHSVKLLYVLQNYHFSNIDCSGLVRQNFSRFVPDVSKWPELNH